jgi:hypothetical protein
MARTIYTLPPFRVWYDDHRRMLYFPDAYRIGGIPGERLIMQSTGILTPNCSRPIYEDDIISFTVKGIAHGPEPEPVAAAHVWWCQESACWAFGNWVMEGIVGRPPMTWYYTMQDRIDRATIRVLGNVWENPEMVSLLGYNLSAAR